MFLKRSEESYSNVCFNGEKVDFDSFEHGNGYPHLLP